MQVSEIQPPRVLGLGPSRSWSDFALPSSAESVESPCFASDAAAQMNASEYNIHR